MKNQAIPTTTKTKMPEIRFRILMDDLAFRSKTRKRPTPNIGRRAGGPLVKKASPQNALLARNKKNRFFTLKESKNKKTRQVIAAVSNKPSNPSVETALDAPNGMMQVA
ncbi:MAG: hypothetical protein AB7D05_07825 [Mangrovibacterium sp.]